MFGIGKKFNILITGVNGQLGSYLYNDFRHQSFKKYSDIGHVFGIGRQDLDLCNKDIVSNFFATYVIDPPIDLDYVIHCAAATDTTAIEKDPFKYYKDNVLATKNVAKSCCFNKIKMIFISSDFVFSEFDQPKPTTFFTERPCNQYGLQKLLAEKYVKENYTNWRKGYMILRASWMFGNSKNSFIEKFIRNLFNEWNTVRQEGIADSLIFPVDNTAKGRPTSVQFMSTFIHELMRSRFYGTTMAQPLQDHISRYDWAKKIVDALKSTAKKNKNTTSDFIIDALSHITLEPTRAEDLNLPMKYPGLNLSVTASYTNLESYKHERIVEQAAIKASESYETLHYIEKNFDRICKELIEPTIEICCQPADKPSS